MKTHYFSRNSRMSSSLLMLSVIGVISLVYLGYSSSNRTIKEDILPLKSSDTSTLFKINPLKDTVLTFETGSILKIKKNSFLDEKGNVIEDLVNLRYREFHSVGETILANIPMEYDSMGKTYHFESAGMFEILAESNDKRIFLDKSLPIEVDLVTLNTTQNQFNQYYFNPTTQKWEYIQKDTVQSIETKLPEIGNEQKVEISQNQLIKPILKNRENKQFVISFQKNRYPELEVFNKVIFEVSNENKSFDIRKTKSKWLDVEVERINKSTNYSITFLGSNEKYNVIAYPVLDSMDFQSASVTYNLLNEDFQKKLQQKRDKELKIESIRKEQEDRYTKTRNNYRNYLKKYEKIYSDSMALVQMNQNRFEGLTNIVYRTFQVQNFGIWNSDCPSSLPEGLLVSADFVNEQGEYIQPTSIFLVEKGRNMIFTYYDKNKISFDPSVENTFLLIKNNTIYWVDNEVFKKVKEKDKSFVFQANTLKKESYTSSDINSII